MVCRSRKLFYTFDLKAKYLNGKSDRFFLTFGQVFSLKAATYVACSGSSARPAVHYGSSNLLLKSSQCENVPKTDQSCIPEHLH